MRRRSAKPNTQPHSERLGRKVGPPTLMKDTEDQAFEIANEQKVLRLTLQGHNQSAIGKEIGRDVRTVRRILARALEEYRANHAEEIEHYVAVQVATYRADIRTLSARAAGGTIIEKDPATGEERERRIEPDNDAMALKLRAQRQIDMLLAGRQALKIEHIGAGGGPIQMNLGPQEVARAMRERFGGSVTRTAVIPSLPPQPTSLDASTNDGSDSEH